VREEFTKKTKYEYYGNESKCGNIGEREIKREREGGRELEGTVCAGIQYRNRVATANSFPLRPTDEIKNKEVI
jgi:hypothetical protein